MSIVGVVLGARESSRFGEPKQLLPFGDTTLLGQVVRNANASSPDRFVVVLVRASEEVRGALDFGRAGVVENTAYGTGRASRLLTALDAAADDCEALILILGGQPLVRAGAVKRLVGAFEKGAMVAVATYGGKPRNPVLFSREMWRLLMIELSGDKGARPFLWRHPKLVMRVPCDGVGDPADVDTAVDLRCLEEMHTRKRSYK
jgi:CTP:molybdopterin cytidylyltransferase MocA